MQPHQPSALPTTTRALMAIEPPKSNSLDPINILLRFIVILWNLTAFLAGGIARWCLGWLSQSFSITLRMSTLMLILVICLGAAWTVVRYRLMTMYSRLPEDDEDEKEDELWLDGEPEKPAYATYFDEFLAAIKIFGYLDKKVFDELTRHMRTFRIDEGETIYLKDLDGFAVVVSGCMQIYNKSGDQFQLINKVKKAGPISPLFSVLSLLASEVEIRQNIYSSESRLNNSDIPDLDLNAPCPDNDDDDEAGPQTTFPSEYEKIEDNIYATAEQTSRIAIIPSQTFRLLARKFPMQTANIVQVVLTRWFQVTMNTCGDFLELTELVTEAEMDLNRASTSRVPTWIKEGAVKRLHHAANEDPDVNVFTLKPRKKHYVPQGSSREVHHVSLEQIDKNYPGDLVSNVPILSRSNSVFDQDELLRAFSSANLENEAYNAQQPPPRQHGSASDDSEDAVSRKAVVDEMFKLMGFDGRMLPEKKQAHRESFIVSTPNSPMFSPSPAFPFNTKLGPSSSKMSLASEASSAVGATPVNEPISYDELINTAANLVQIQLYRKGELLSKRGERCSGIFYVVEGKLSSYCKGKHVYDANEGNVAGYLETIASQLSYFEVRAESDVVVARLSKKNFERLSDLYPLIYLSTAKVFTRITKQSIMLFNFALEWTHLNAGETLYREGSPADAIYCVVSGRIRSFYGPKTPKGKPELKGEYGQGRYLAQLETLVGDNYNCTAVAIRETELARIPKTLIEFLSTMYPQAPFKMTKLVADEVSRKDKIMQAGALPALSSINEFSTVAVLPVGDDLPVKLFASKLVDGFRGNGRDAIHLDRATVLAYLGRHAFSGMGALKLKMYLAGLEQQHETLVYVADDASINSQWTRTCVEQADCVLLVVNATAGSPVLSDYEKMMARSKIHNRCHLILLHNDEYVKPGTTASWLKRRKWITAYHHVQMDLNMVPVPEPRKGLDALREIKNKIQSEFNDRNSFKPPTVKSQHNHYKFKNDFARLARILSGEAIALVLGGGGARGLAHLGIIKALEEKGIPIDMVGGTSIGSFVGGLYAQDYDTLAAYRQAKKFSSRFASIWHILLDLTYPATSYTTGHAFNRGIWKAFGNVRIEDFWLKYFCNTTNITHSRMEIHKSGYAWRYIRASMSLAGLVPPLEDKGNMLLDGGYMDNLPVGEMQSMGAKFIIAVDVGSVDDTTPMTYGDSLSGMWVLWNRFNPFSSHPNIPNLAEIQARLAYVSSVKALEAAKCAANVLYLRPPIDLYATLDFGKFDEIMSVGYTYAIRKIRELEETGQLDHLSGIKDSKDRWVPDLNRRHSF